MILKRHLAQSREHRLGIGLHQAVVVEAVVLLDLQRGGGGGGGGHEGDAGEGPRRWLVNTAAGR